MELHAKLENLGMFHIFFTLSCADRRYPENFTSLLQDHNISYKYEAGRQVVLIDGETIEEFLSRNSSIVSPSISTTWRPASYL